MSLPCDILLVNNGSRDGSEGLIHESGFPFIDLPENQGVGRACIVAIEWALERNYDIVGIIAGNGKMLPSEIPRLLEPILSDCADFVSGSRFMKGGTSPNLPGFRKNTIPLVGYYVWLLTGVHLTDATCGFRAFKLDIIRRAEFNWKARWLNRYCFEPYLYAKVLLDKQIRCCEVPVTMRYPPKGHRYSKIPPIIGWYQILMPWIVARLDGKGFSKSHRAG